VTAVNFEFGARQRLSATWAWSWDSAYHADVMWQIANLTRFSNFWYKEKRVVTIDIMDVHNREVGKFSQEFCDFCHAGRETSAIKLY